MRRVGLATLLALAASCGRHTGTISVSVVGAPDGALLRRIDRLQATFGGGAHSTSAMRGANGALNLSLEFVADSGFGDLRLEGFATGGELVAVGSVGPLPASAIDTRVAVYMGAPMSISEAPVSLSAARSHMGSTAASFGVLLAGGLGTDGPVADVQVYSSYLHTIVPARSLPQARSDIAVIPGATGFIYLVGGDDDGGMPRSESYALDLTSPPAGSYRPFAVSQEYARSGVSTAVAGSELFLVSGSPALLLDGLRGTLDAIPGAGALDGPAATSVFAGDLRVILGGAGVIDPASGEAGAAIYEGGRVARIAAPPEMRRTEHRALALANQDVLFVGGAIDGIATNTAVVYKASTGRFEVRAFLDLPRRNPAVALTDRYLLVIGGEDDAGDAIGSVEVFDADTLEPVATLPMLLPRKNATAQALSNGQVLIAGGQGPNGEPLAELDLFTP